MLTSHISCSWGIVCGIFTFESLGLILSGVAVSCWNLSSAFFEDLVRCSSPHNMCSARIVDVSYWHPGQCRSVLAHMSNGSVASQMVSILLVL